MTFTLPDLPYAYDALQPYMSKETLEFHHNKHHAAYVNTGNTLLKGSELEGKSVEEVRGIRDEISKRVHALLAELVPTSA